MVEASGDAIKRYKRVFRAVYNYMEQAEAALAKASEDEPEALDRAWEAVSSEGADLIEQWDCDAFIIDLLMAIASEQYRRYYEQ